MDMVDYTAQRRNMVESQVRPSDVTDRRIMLAMQAVPREAFVTDVMKPLAYMDGEVRMSDGSGNRPPRTLLAPRTLARLLDLAAVEPHHVVLDVGAGSGYSSAVLGRLAETVVALEAESSLADRATATLAALSLDNVAVMQGALAAGWPKAAPYDVIVVEGAIASEPAALFEQLDEGGRLVAVHLSGGAGQAVVWQRRGETVSRRVAFDAAAPRLAEFDSPPVFSF
ncbi:MAG: protein-L-isoaspartate O-methyltransferase family protein [Hyphomicrobium sp.]